MGARYTVFCGSQELKPLRHEDSKGRRSRQGGEPHLRDRTLGGEKRQELIAEDEARLVGTREAKPT